MPQPCTSQGFTSYYRKRRSHLIASHKFDLSAFWFHLDSFFIILWYDKDRIFMQYLQYRLGLFDDSCESALKSIEFDPSAQNFQAYNQMCLFALPKVNATATTMFNTYNNLRCQLSLIMLRIKYKNIWCCSYITILLHVLYFSYQLIFLLRAQIIHSFLILSSSMNGLL